ncbi:MAG: hypothetical protein EBT50_07575 [Verrucomicrobia bacterium]|nr:hypothetical protein [Verrucomicrobiota bacterium]
MFSGGGIGEKELPVGGGFGPGGRRVGGGLAEGLEIQVFVAVGEIDTHSHRVFLPVRVAGDGEPVGAPGLHAQPADFRNEVGGRQDEIHPSQIGTIGGVAQLNRCLPGQFSPSRFLG